MSQGHAGKKDDLSQNADYGNQGGGSSATTWSPAHDDHKSRWPQAQFVEPRRPDPCAGNRQDAAGNCRCMQGRSPQPCRRRPFPAQASGPHRRARWETLRHTVNEYGPTGRVLILDKRVRVDSERSRSISAPRHRRCQPRGEQAIRVVKQRAPFGELKLFVSYSDRYFLSPRIRVLRDILGKHGWEIVGPPPLQLDHCGDELALRSIRNAPT